MPEYDFGARWQTYVTGECCYEFFSVRVILHGGSVGFRDPQNLAGGIHDGGASTGRLRYFIHDVL